MDTRAARDSCDTTYHDAQSSADGDDTVSKQGSATQEGPAASETPLHTDAQREWLSELIGKFSMIALDGAHRLIEQALFAHRFAMGEGI